MFRRDRDQGRENDGTNPVVGCRERRFVGGDLVITELAGSNRPTEQPTDVGEL